MTVPGDSAIDVGIFQGFMVTVDRSLNRSPCSDKESNWLPTPAGTFSLYVCAYWGRQDILDGSWKPPVIHKVG
jgi:hypothetical protein